MKNPTKVIYLIGTPGTGKYTISQELAKFGFIVCDNHLVNNPIFSLLNFDGSEEAPKFAWNAIWHIRNAVFDFIAKEKNNSYVLTNCLYEDKGDKELFNQVETMAEKRGSLFIPVMLLISEEENLKRITNPARKERWKSINPKHIYSETPLLKINHPNLLEIDVSNLSAYDAAIRILDYTKQLEA